VIGSLRGTLLHRDPAGELLVEVAGVGYRVGVGPGTLTKLAEPGQEVFVWVHHHLREDASVLYGFVSRDERACFEALIAAHGVGPSLALAILSVHTPAALHRVLADDDVAALCLVPGVGKKTATRLLVELKSRLDLPDGDGPPPSLDGPSSGPGGADAVHADVRHALTELGYGPDEVAAAMRHLPDGTDAGELLKDALRHLAGATQ
jgi:Holliday junction DNA helicase RuvA